MNRTVKLAKILRSNQTEAEQKLWAYLRAHRLEELKFREQQPFEGYIVDFINYEHRIIIEVDGSQHNEPADLEVDKNRTACFQNNRYRVLRFWDHDVLTNIDGVLEVICKAIHGEYQPLLDTLPSRDGQNTYQF